MAFLVNNLLFVLFTFTVLIGTVVPARVEAVRGVQMSVGRPYFDRMSVPIGVALLFLIGVGPALPWGRATGDQVRARAAAAARRRGRLRRHRVRARSAHSWTLVTLVFGGYAAQVTLGELWLPVGQRMRARGEGFVQALAQVSGAAGAGPRRSSSTRHGAGDDRHRGQQHPGHVDRGAAGARRERRRSAPTR